MKRTMLIGCAVAALALSNDWTLAGMMYVTTASYVFDFGTSTLDYDPDKTKAEIVKTTIDGVAALQVKVERLRRGVVLFLK